MRVEPSMKLEQIELGRLVAHPKNANVMSGKVMRKLRRHIEQTGRYEPLVVRPHPVIADSFELINGHHRKEVLASLGHATACCVVWPLDDAQTLMLLATINRLSGTDAAGKRVDLLEALAGHFNATAGELAALLPEDEATLLKVLSTAQSGPIADPPAVADLPEAFTVFLTAAEKRRLVAALRATDRDPAKALMKWMEVQAE